jgi:hypothetical protein
MIFTKNRATKLEVELRRAGTVLYTGIKLRLSHFAFKALFPPGGRASPHSWGSVSAAPAGRVVEESCVFVQNSISRSCGFDAASQQ